MPYEDSMKNPADDPCKRAFIQYFRLLETISLVLEANIHDDLNRERETGTICNNGATKTFAPLL